MVQMRHLEILYDVKNDLNWSRVPDWDGWVGHEKGTGIIKSAISNLSLQNLGYVHPSEISDPGCFWQFPDSKSLSATQPDKPGLTWQEIMND